MKRQLRIFVAGVMVVLPFALTGYVVWWAGSGLDAMGRAALGRIAPAAGKWLFPGVGALLLVVAIYLVGLLMHLWAFRWGVKLLERLFSRVPVVKSIYESLRDILQLFGGDAGRMGQVVRYRLPGTDVQLLGIRTSTAPRGAGEGGKVAVYLPMSYQFGGFTVYVPPEAVEPIDMTVEEALKIAATGDVGSTEAAPPDAPAQPPSQS